MDLSAVASIPASVWPASIAAGAAVVTTVIGLGNRRKLNGLRAIERELGELASAVSRMDRDWERHLTDHRIYSATGKWPEID